MALMHLLTVGRSLSAVRDDPHRYKLRSGALPTFGNPAGPVLEKRFGVGAATTRGRRDETNERVVGAKPMTTQTVGEETKASNSNALPTGWLKKNPFKSARVAVPRPTVQGELSLDKVKPVRNDLSDSDLELVAAAKPGAKPTASAARVGTEEIPLVKAQPVLARVLALFQRRN